MTTWIKIYRASSLIAEEMGRGVVNMLHEKLKMGSVPEKLMK